MKVVLDNIIYSKEKQGGISNYWYELSAGLLRNPSIETFFYDDKYAELNLCRQRLNIAADHLISNKDNGSVFLARLSAINIPFNGPYLYHSSFYRPVKHKKDVIEVTTVHDFTHNYYSPWHKRLVHNSLKYSSIKRAKGIICVSQNTCNDLYKFCNVKGKEVTVIHNGVSDDYFVKTEYTLAEKEFLKKVNPGHDKFLLFVGGRTGYKNFDFVIDLLAGLNDYKLMLVGTELTEIEKKQLQIRNLLNRTLVANNIQNFELNLLYNFAHCLVYPSSYEGFGIPVVEAMKAGCPVLALNKSSIPEIATGAAVLIDNLDIDRFKREVRNLENGDYRKEKITKGIERSVSYSWKACVTETIDFYKHIYL